MKETWCALSFVYTESTASLHSALVTINILLIIFVINNNQQGGKPVRRRRLLWRAHPPTRAWRGDWRWAAWGRLPPGRRRLAARWKLKWWSCVQYWIKLSYITGLQVLYAFSTCSTSLIKSSCSKRFICPTVLLLTFRHFGWLWYLVKSRRCQIVT